MTIATNSELGQRILNASTTAVMTNSGCDGDVVWVDHVYINNDQYKITWLPTDDYEAALADRKKYHVLLEEYNYGDLTDEDQAELDRLEKDAPWTDYEDESCCCDWDDPYEIELL